MIVKANGELLWPCCDGVVQCIFCFSRVVTVFFLLTRSVWCLHGDACCW